MKNFIIQFSRLFVGVLFIISGLIKLNDPIGFSYKLEEYFSQTVFNIPFLVPFALAIALFLVVLEIILGIMLLIGFKSKQTIWSLLILIVLFSFLTFYSAYFQVVKDCGCFGDALKLTPWQSFIKDVVLLVFILILTLNSKYVKPVFKTQIQKYIIITSLFLSCFMGYWVINHLPILDFRPYKKGTNIRSAMEIPENAPKSVYELVFIYKINGVEKVFAEKDLMSLPENAEFVDRKDRVVVQGYVPPVHDFKLEVDGDDRTYIVLTQEKTLLVVAYDLEKASPEGLSKVNDLRNQAQSKGYYVVFLTGSSQEVIQKTIAKYNFQFEVMTCDATTLKTIERANPSFITLNYGTVIQKVHYNDIHRLKL